MTLTEQIAIFGSILQEIGSDLYIRAFQNNNISALTIGQFRYLEIIAKTPGITPGELTDIFEVKKPTVTQIINKLLKKKLIEKRPSEGDKRVSNLYPTEITHDIIQYRYSMYEIYALRVEKILTKKELEIYGQLNTKIINKFYKAEE